MPGEQLTIGVFARRSRLCRSLGSPREVYFTDFDAAGPDDECVDIAFVIAT